jgi:hypothetical protein
MVGIFLSIDLLIQVECEGSRTYLIDLRNSTKRCPGTIGLDLEYLLLLAGLFAVPPDNLHRLHNCSIHYNHLLTARRKNNCELCKLVRNKTTSCPAQLSLQSLSKPLAVALWNSRQLSMYNYWACIDCRKYFEQEYTTDDTSRSAEQMFQRLYDD